MEQWLLVGDPHVVVDELADCQALIDGIAEVVIKTRDIDRIVFMGDQHHNHAIMHVEVMAFWRKALQRLGKLAKVTLLVGNHDMPGDGSSSSHALMAYADIEGVTVVDRPLIIDGRLMLPYYHDQEEFARQVEACYINRVYCHQTFNGSKFENGFYAKDGIDPDRFKNRAFISGHIHTPQRFQNVTYIGAPRWRTLSDAGVDRALIICKSDGSEMRLVPTDRWCKRLVHVVERQGEPAAALDRNPKWGYIVDLHGDEEFIKARTAYWAGSRIRTFKTQQKVSRVRESMGISQAISLHLETFRPLHGTPVEELRRMVESRIP